MSRWIRGLWMTTLVGAAALATHEWRSRIQPTVHHRYGRDLRELQALDARLNSQVMESRQALVAQYDDMVRTAAAIQTVHTRLEDVPTFLGKQDRGDVKALVTTSRDATADKAALVESFKSENAILRNSVRFFPLAAKSLRDELSADPRQAEGARRVNDVLTSVLEYSDLPGSRDAWLRAEKSIEDLESTPPPPGHEEDVEVVLRHAHTVVERGAEVDSLTNQILAVPTADATVALDSAYERSVQQAIRAGEHRRILLFSVALSAVILLGIDIILRLRRSAAQERKASEQLAQANKVLLREKEREKELSELKSRFVSMTSHEFRTPLSVILSSTELLEAYGDRWTPAKKADHFSRIKTATGGMTEMLDSILVIGKSEVGKLECRPAPLDIARWARHLADTFEPTLGTKHTLDTQIDGSFDDAYADEKLLNHIVTNLLSNAVKYSPKGGTVRFETKRVLDKAVFVVSDQGIGIPEKDRERLFESFHRCSNVGHIPGTGLGLAVVKRAVDAHGGELSLESEAGQGTTFTVSIPLRTISVDGAAA